MHGVAKPPGRRAPNLSEHADEILSELGFDSKGIEGLRKGMGGLVIPLDDRDGRGEGNRVMRWTTSERLHSICGLELNCLEKKNAMTRAMHTRPAACFNEAGEDHEEVRVVVLAWGRARLLRR